MEYHLIFYSPGDYPDDDDGVMLHIWAVQPFGAIHVGDTINIADMFGDSASDDPLCVGDVRVASMRHVFEDVLTEGFVHRIELYTEELTDNPRLT